VGGKTFMVNERRVAQRVGTETNAEDAVDFRVAEVIPVISGQRWRVLFSWENAEYVVRAFGFTRQYASTSIADYASIVDKTNDAAWNGLDKGTVKYAGAEYTMKAGIVTITYNFLWRREPWALVQPPMTIVHSGGELTAGTWYAAKVLRDTYSVSCDAAWNRDSFTTFGF
jgi:hypothetical protein